MNTLCYDINEQITPLDTLLSVSAQFALLKREYLLGGMPLVDRVDLLAGVEGVAPEEPGELVAMSCLSQ